MTDETSREADGRPAETPADPRADSPGPDPSGPPADGAPPDAEGAAEASPDAAGAPAKADAAPDAEPKSPPKRKEPPTVIARYGSMQNLARFRHNLSRVKRGQGVIVKSDRGQELGIVVCDYPHEGGCCAAGVEIAGDVLRLATHADEVEQRHLVEAEERAFRFCRERIAARGLPMRLVKVEHLFGGDRIVFYFTAESRVDFRALVRDLAHEFQTRIEMRQIGVRDEARLKGDYERCGRPLCCRSWMKELAPISMKMAKVQKATLDPAKISGACGRLMCCLRFEHATYMKLRQALPKRNTYVVAAEGLGKVLSTDVVTQTVRLLVENGSTIVVPNESILERDVDPAAVSARSRAGARDEGRSGAGDAGAGDKRSGRRRGRRRSKGSGSGGGGRGSGGKAGDSSGGGSSGGGPKSGSGGGKEKGGGEKGGGAGGAKKSGKRRRGRRRGGRRRKSSKGSD